MIERSHEATGESDQIFEDLGFERMGRHWRHGELFVETLPGPVAGPVEDVVDALEVLEELARSDASVTHERPLSLVDDLQR